MNNQSNFAKLLLRLGFGGFMMTHGYGKLLRFFDGKEIEFMNFLGLGDTVSLALTVFAEFVCAALVLIGFKTRWAALPIVFAMLVAAFVAHADDPIGKKEFALLYAVGFMAISLLGAGKYSVDRK